MSGRRRGPARLAATGAAGAQDVRRVVGRKLIVAPIAEDITLEELLERLAVLRDGVEEMRDFYEALWGGLDERRQGLLRVMGDGDLLQLELVRAEE